jgi:FkbM family methyltransferase
MRRGHRMEVPANSAQSWRAAFTGSYDDAELDLLVPFVRQGSLVLDIGASLGFYTIPLAQVVRARAGRLVAVEPIYANCEVLRRNLAVNGLTEVASVLPVALGAEDAQVLLHVESGGTGNATIVSGLAASEVARHDKAGGTGATQPASVRRLDDLELPFGELSMPCSLVKIDAEGFEMNILEGASEFVAGHRPVIFGEFHPVWLKTRGVPATEPQRWAVVNGYDCMELTHRRTHPLVDMERVGLRPLPEGVSRSGASLLLIPRSDE